MRPDPRAESVGDRQGDGTAGPATTGGLVTVPDQHGKAEEQEALIDQLEARREELLRRLGHGS
jgi:hypothetical protein